LFSDGIVEILGEYYKKSVRYLQDGKPHYLRFNDCHLTLERAQEQAESKRRDRIKYHQEKILGLESMKFTRARKPK
jgi:hypothetical protein